MKSLCTYVVEDYMSSFESVDYVQTFKGLKMRFEQEKDRLTRKNTDRLILEKILLPNCICCK